MTAKTDIKIKDSNISDVRNFGTLTSPINLAFIHISPDGAEIKYGEVIGHISAEKKVALNIASSPEDGYITSIHSSGGKLFLETAGKWTPESLKTLEMLGSKLRDIMAEKGVKNILLYAPTIADKFFMLAGNDGMESIDTTNLTSVRINAKGEIFALNTKINAIISYQIASGKLKLTNIIKMFGKEEKMKYMSRIKANGEMLISCENGNLIHYNSQLKKERVFPKTALSEFSDSLIGSVLSFTGGVFAFHPKGVSIVPMNFLPTDFRQIAETSAAAV